MKKQLTKSTTTPCNIWEVKALTMSDCNNKGTDDHEDDNFKIDALVEFVGDIPTTGNLVLVGTIDNAPPVIKSVPVQNLTQGSWTFNDMELPALVNKFPIVLTAYFDAANPACTFTNNNAGPLWNGQPLWSPAQCSVCTGPSGTVGSPNIPSCWPPAPSDPSISTCNNPLNYCGNANSEEETPIKYLKIVYHIFQREDPNNPENFTIAHLGLMNAWVAEMNNFYSNLCDSPNDNSPSISDSRIRFLNNGIVGEDIFFYQNDEAWGTALSGCTNNPGFSYNGWGSGTFFANAVNNRPLETRNAFHVFITGPRWEDNLSQGTIGSPDATDCYYYCPGGYTSGLTNCNGLPFAVITGRFHEYQIATGAIPDDCNGTTQMDINKIGLGFVGELFHYLGLDHLSPLQAHFAGGDFCDDTPLHDEYNKMDCGQGPRCALTCCQFGRIHYRIDHNTLPLERFLISTNPNTYSLTEPDYCNVSQPNIVIPPGPEIVWDYPRKLSANVIVPTGASLRIICKVGMPNGGKMTIEKGGRLTVDGGTVYNNCDAGWKGFVVEGNANLPWSSQNQGYLKLIHAAKVEGAINSMEVKGGGRVYSNDESTIHNCGGAFFYAYSQSNSIFLNTNFTYDGSIMAVPISYLTHVYLINNHGTLFSNCDFSATNVPSSLLSQTSGISALGSVFSVGYGSTFNGFNVGIVANNWINSPMSNFSVSSSGFTGNSIGISTWGCKNYAIVDNIFNVGGGAYTNAPKTTGVSMSNSTGYVVEKNHFVGANSIPSDRIGIFTEKSGLAANFIKKNYFDFLGVANQAKGVNSSEEAGLQYLCNVNQGHNTRDFFVEGNGGIYWKQGSGKAARNIFSHNNAGMTDNDFRNLAPGIRYYHLNNSAQIPQYPTGVTNIQTTLIATCPGDPGDDGEILVKLTLAQWQENESKFNEAKLAWQTQKDSLHELLDGGNTTALLGEINGVNNMSAHQVIQHLQSLSPYLSSQVLEAAIGKISILTTNAVQDILMANPDELAKPNLISAIQASFSANTAIAILSQTGATTSRTGKEENIGASRAAMYHHADVIIRDIVRDTPTINLTLLRTWLGKKQSIEAEYAIVGTYLSENNFTTAYEKISAIPQSYILDEAQAQSHNKFVALMDIWKGVMDSGTLLTGLPLSTVSNIQAIADSDPGLAGAMSRGMLNILYGYNYKLLPADPSGNLMPLVAPPISNIVSKYRTTQYITAYPNPIRNGVTFNWNLPRESTENVIVLMDLQGKEIRKLVVYGQYGSNYYELEGLNAGVYFYKIRFTSGESEMAKLVIIK